ncbi:Protein quaking [Dirofilaria immitis]|nr:Protein quaking [Dirofilaria immitis]
MQRVITPSLPVFIRVSGRLAWGGVITCVLEVYRSSAFSGFVADSNNIETLTSERTPDKECCSANKQTSPSLLKNMETTAAASIGQRCTPIGQPLLKMFKDFETFTPFAQPKTPKKQLLPLRNDKGNIGPGNGNSTQGEITGTECTMEYLADLLKEKNSLLSFHRFFAIWNVWLMKCHFSIERLDLPEPEGEPVTIQEKVYVPRKEHPDYNFVGRILGPRGMTAKQLEQETGCKIMVRGRGSMRDRRKEEMNRGKPNWEHLDDELHVLVQCEDTPNRAYTKLKAAPEGTDELKRKQLMELAIINGTYRPVNKYPLQTPRLIAPMTLVSPIRHPNGSIAAQPIFVSPTGSPITPGTNINTPTGVNAFMQSSNIDYNMMMNQLSFDTTLQSFPMAGDYQAHSSAAYPTTTSLLNAAATTGNNNTLQSYFIESNPITPPESTGSGRR